MKPDQVSAIPVAVRRIIYVVYGAAGLAAGATHAAYASVGDHHVPGWLGVVETVLLFLGTAVGGTAVAHTGSAGSLSASDAGTGSDSPTTDAAPAVGPSGAVSDEPAGTDPTTDATVGVVVGPRRATVDQVAIETANDPAAPGAIDLNSVPDLPTDVDTTDVVNLPAGTTIGA